MSTSCPSCGAAAEFESLPARLFRGHCGSCGGSFTIAQEGAPGEPGSAAASVEAGAAGPSAPSPARAGPALLCPDCEEPLEVRARSGTSLETSCASCGTVVRYVLERPSEWAPPRGGPAAGPERGRGRAPMGGPAARPCRECGGPLSFSTDEQGNVTGTCSSCGNTFTLPPRREGARPGFGPRRPGPGGRFGPPRGRFGAPRGRFGPPRGRFGAPRSSDGGPPRRSWGGSGDRPDRFRRGPRRSDDEGDEERPRRRRVRRE